MALGEFCVFKTGIPGGPDKHGFTGLKTGGFSGTRVAFPIFNCIKPRLLHVTANLNEKHQ